MSSNIQIRKTCEYCQQEFIAKTTKTRYCSHRCNQRHYKQLKREEKIQTAEQKEANPPEDAATFETIAAKKYLSIKEAALLLGVSERTFYRLMKDGTVKSHKLGGRTIIRQTDIDNLFN